MVGSGAGRGDGIADALDLEPGRQRRRRARTHRLRHGERTDPLRPLAARDVGGVDDRARRRAAGAHDDASALVGQVGFLEPAVADRLLHRNVVPGGAAAEEAHCAAVDRFLRLQRRRRLNLAAKAEFGIVLGARDARTPFAQAREHLLRRIAEEETIPMPVMTTRLIEFSRMPAAGTACATAQPRAPAASAGFAAPNRPTRKSLTSYMRRSSASNQPSAMPRTSLPRNTRFTSTP